jgi:hypothetical protein
MKRRFLVSFSALVDMIGCINLDVVGELKK